MRILTDLGDTHGYRQQLSDLAPAVLLSCLMFAAVFAVRFAGLSDIVTLLIQVPLGVLIYVGGSRLFKLESFDYMLKTAKSLLKKK